MKLLILITALIFAGCAGNKSSSGDGTTSKSIFSVWTRDDMTLTINMTSGSFGSFPVQWGFAAGQKCNSTVTISGTEASGNYSVTSSTYAAGTGTPATDPGCSSLNQVGTYNKASTTLNICTNGVTCGAYL